MITKEAASRPDVKLSLLRKMKGSLINVAKVMFKHYCTLPFSPMHHKLSDLLIDVIEKKHNLLIILPRGFAKSTFSLLFFVIWNLIFSEKRYILIIGEGHKAIKRHFIDKLMHEIENNPVLKALGIRKGAVWKGGDELQIEVICPSIKYGGTRIVKIEAVSYGVSVRGASKGEQRPDLVLIDDLERQKTKTAAGVESQDYRDDVVRWFFSQIVPIGGETGTLQIVFMGTIMHSAQLLVKLYSNDMKGALKFKVLKFGYILKNEKGERRSLWPEKYSLQDLDDLREDYHAQGLGNEFANEFLSEIQDPRNQIFKESDFRYYYRVKKDIIIYKSGAKSDYADEKTETQLERRIAINDLLIYVLVDPAVSEDDSNCDSAITTIGVTSRYEWIVLDCIYGKWGGNALWEKIFQAQKKFPNVVTVGIEGVGYQKAIPDALYNMMIARGEYFHAESIKNNGQNKFDRIISTLEWRYIQHKIFHDINADHTTALEEQLKMISLDGAKGLVDIADALALGGDLIVGAGSDGRAKKTSLEDDPFDYFNSGALPRSITKTNIRQRGSVV